MNSSGYSSRRLYRSSGNRMITGVCGGIAEYLSVDPTLVRLAFVLLTILNGAGLLIYIVMAIIVPLNPSTSVPATRLSLPDLSWIGISIALVIGLALISFGLAWITDQFLPWTWGLQQIWIWIRNLARIFWGIVVIAIGLVIIIAALKRK